MNGGWLWGPYVSEEGLKNLHTHSYSGVDRSITTKLLTNYWEWLVRDIVPTTVAPNTLTLAGGCCMAVAYALCVYYAGAHLDTPVPAFILLLSGVLTFAYQTLDAIDGKQARKTKTSSPLGELFDHGVDSVVYGLMGPMLAACACCPPRMALLMVTLSHLPFYLSHWEHLHTGTMEFGVVGPCEIHYVVIAFLGLFAAVGTPMPTWSIPPFLGPGVPFRVCFLAVIVSILAMSAMNVISVMQHKNGGVTAVRRLTPLALFHALALLWGLSDPAALDSAPHAFLLAISMVFAYITQRLQAQRVSKSPVKMFYPIFIAIAFAAVNGYAGFLPRVPVAWAVAALSVVQEAIYAVSFVRQVSSFLHIRPFTITP